MNNAKRYKAECKTKPGPAIPFYRGTVTVYARSEDDARAKARRQYASRNGLPVALVVVQKITCLD